MTLSFQKLALFISLVIISIEGHSQSGSISLEVDTIYPTLIDSRAPEAVPDLIGIDNGAVFLKYLRGYSRHGEEISVVKANPSSGGIDFKIDIETEEFRDQDVILQEAKLIGGQVHLIYSTKTSSQDSTYLLKKVINETGVISPFQIMSSSWVVDDESSNLSYKWDKTNQNLVSIALLKNPENDQASILRRVFDQNLNLRTTDTFNINVDFDHFRIISTLHNNDESFLLFTVSSEEGQGSGVMKLFSQGISIARTRINHQNSRAYSLHAVGDDIHFSYLYYSNRRYSALQGFASYVLNFNGEEQTRFTDIDFSETVENYNAFLRFFSKVNQKGRHEIKNIIPHPSGGFLVFIHKNIAIQDIEETNYYSREYTVSYINSSDVVEWTHVVPLEISSTNPIHLNSLTTFTEELSFVTLIPNDEENTINWNNGEFDDYELGSSVATVIEMALDGSIKFYDIYKAEKRTYLPLSFGSIVPTGERNMYYSLLFSTRSNEASLMKVVINGLPSDVNFTDYNRVNYVPKSGWQ